MQLFFFANVKSSLTPGSKPERSSNQSIDIRGLAPEKLPDRARDRRHHVSLYLARLTSRPWEGVEHPLLKLSICTHISSHISLLEEIILI